MFLVRLARTHQRKPELVHIKQNQSLLFNLFLDLFGFTFSLTRVRASALLTWRTPEVIDGSSDGRWWSRAAGGPVMLPASLHPSAASSHVSRYLNTPEEDDETMSTEEREASGVHEPGAALRPDAHRPAPDRSVFTDDSRFGGPSPDSAGFCCYQPPGRLPAGYSQPTPFPSWADGAWLHPSYASSWSGYPGSLPSALSRKDPSRLSGDDSSLSGYKFVSLPGRRSPSVSSLEQPFSLCSNPPSGNLCHHTLSPYSCSPQGAACCALRPADGFNGAPAGAWPPYHPAYGPYDPGACRRPGAGYSQHGRVAPAKEKPPPHSAPLSLEQRRVFVTYESDDDKHVNEVINFVALLRHNGFDTHIDIFEQQFRSISKIDFMERYLSEKEYLIIIIISPKYYESVTASPVGLENDERTFNTVYIHKQLQNEFIQNGSKNFRFIPIVFPGAKKCHVPNWLQNTHVYEWPLHRDDVLRRLMRVEKYNPPPIGALPTIVSIPI